MKLVRTNDDNYECPDDPGEAGYDVVGPRRSVTDEEGEILANLASGRRVLEIGTGLAVATRYLASTAREVVTVDPDSWVEDPGIANVRFMRSIPVGEVFDLAFIDGNHKYEAVMHDIARTNSLLIALHDTYLEDVQRAVKDCRLKVVMAYPTRCQLTLYRR